MPNQAPQATPAAQLHLEPSLQDKRKGTGLLPVTLGAAIPKDYRLFLLTEGQHAVPSNAFSMSSEKKLITPSFNTQKHTFLFTRSISCIANHSYLAVIDLKLNIRIKIFGQTHGNEIGNTDIHFHTGMIPFRNYL